MALNVNKEIDTFARFEEKRKCEAHKYSNKLLSLRVLFGSITACDVFGWFYSL